METKQIKVLNEKQLKSKWNNLSDVYTSMIESNTLEIAQNFLKTLQKYRTEANLKNKEIEYLELACGSGLFAMHLFETSNLKFQNALLVDLSETMIEKTSKNLTQNAESLKLHLSKTKKCPFDHIKVQIHLGNVEKIDFVPESSKDLVISNLVLHLVENPANLLAQSYRTLKIGHIAYFSVLAEYQDSSKFNAVPNLLKKYGWNGNGTRSVFHLGTEEKLRSIIPIDKFEILGTQLVRSTYDKSNVNLIDFIFSLKMHSDFVNSLEASQKAQLILEHEKLVEEFKQGKKELVFNVRAIFLKKK